VTPSSNGIGQGGRMIPIAFQTSSIFTHPVEVVFPRAHRAAASRTAWGFSLPNIRPQCAFRVGLVRGGVRMNPSRGKRSREGEFRSSSRKPPQVTHGVRAVRRAPAGSRWCIACPRLPGGASRVRELRAVRASRTGAQHRFGASARSCRSECVADRRATSLRREREVVQERAPGTERKGGRISQ
jgi:hypothetical protein